MKPLLSHDVPRPQDNAQKCAERIALGHNHAVVDLIDALEREQDPRFTVCSAMLEEAMSRAATLGEDNPWRSTAIVTLWHILGVWFVRVMAEPADQLDPEAILKRFRKNLEKRDAAGRKS